MLVHEAVKLLGAALGLILGTGTIVVGVVQAINKGTADAKAFATESIKVIHQDVDALRHSVAADQTTILTRLNEIDLWRKDINGQLKLIGAHMEFGNKLLEAQNNVTTSLAKSNQEMAVALAGIQSVCKLKSGGE